MLSRLILVLALFGLTQPVFAECNGTDLRNTLTPSEQDALADALDGVPYPVGNHWRATRGDAVLHLVGTMHLADPRFDAPVSRLRGIVENADLLLLEMTAEDEAALQQRLTTDPTFLMLPDTTLPELLSEEEWAQMSEALNDRGLPPFMAARFQPWYVSMILAMPPCAMSPELAASGLDGRLEAIAEEAGVPRAALEEVETIFAVFAAQPRATQIEMMLSSLIDTQASEDMFATLLASYFDEATAEGWAVSLLLSKRFAPVDPQNSAEIFAMMEQQLLIDRNRDWIDVLVEATETDDIVVAAFGAAHLPGEDGVLALLEEEGFALERLPF